MNLCIKSVIIFFVLSTSIYAANISTAATTTTKNGGKTNLNSLAVNADLLNYKLEYNKNIISFDGPSMKINLTTKKCNEHILQEFVRTMDNFMHRSTLIKKDSTRFVVYNFNGTITKTDMISEQGQILINALPNEIMRIKIEEKLNCENQK